MRAMILAAGLGQRMRPLTDHTPKPLLTAGGKPLLVYHLEKLASAGIRQVIINLAHLGEKIQAYVGNGSSFGLDVIYSQEPEPLETGGALLKALPLLGAETFLLLNGDVWCDLDLPQFVLPPLAPSHLGRLLLVANPEFHPRGDFTLSESGLITPDANTSPAQRYTFSGISLLKPEIITQYPQTRVKFPLAEALRYAIDRHQLTAMIHAGHWSDVGTPERLAELDNYLAKKQPAA